MDIEKLVIGCGIKYCKTANPMETDKFIPLLKKAVKYSRKKGPAVVISRSPCLLSLSREQVKKNIKGSKLQIPVMGAVTASHILSVQPWPWIRRKK